MLTIALKNFRALYTFIFMKSMNSSRLPSETEGNRQRAPLLIGMSIFTCRHRNASLCAESSRYKNVQELKESDFNSVCEKRQTV